MIQSKDKRRQWLVAAGNGLLFVVHGVQLPFSVPVGFMAVRIPLNAVLLPLAFATGGMIAVLIGSSSGGSEDRL